MVCCDDQRIPDFSSEPFTLIRSSLVAAQPSDIPDEAAAIEHIKNAWIQWREICKNCSTAESSSENVERPSALQVSASRNVVFPAVGPLGSKHVPTQSQVDETRKWLLLAQQRISIVNQKLSIFHRIVKAGETIKSDLQRTIKDYSCFLSPLRRVPPEIWYEIFHLVVSETMCMSDHKCCSRHVSKLQKVCRHWDDILQSAPALWSYVILDIEWEPLFQLECQQIQLSQDTPLHIRLRYPDVPTLSDGDSDDDSDESDFDFTPDEPDVIMAELMLADMRLNMSTLFSEYGSRLKELHMNVEQIWLPLLCYIPAAHCLEQLQIDAGWECADSNAVGPLQILQHFTSTNFPKLRHVDISLDIDTDPILPVPPLSSHISSLCLRYLPVNSILMILASAEALKSVTVQSLIPSPDESTKVVCNMSSFTIIGHMGERLFSRLILPRLSRIRVEFWISRNQPRPQPQSLKQRLVDLLSCSRCPLTSISMKNVLVEEDRLLEIFKLTPQLRVLVLEGHCQSITEKVLQSLICDPTTTEELLLPCLTELEVPVCTEQLDLILTLIESRRPSDLKPLSESIISHLTGALIVPCHLKSGCDRCPNFEIPSSVRKRVDKLRQSGLRLSILSL